MSIVSQCESVVSSISQDRYQVLPFTEKYSRYASYFKFREKEMKEACHIIKLYISGEFSYLAMREQAKRQNNKNEEKVFFDFSKVTFTKSQEAIILISPKIERIEDKVIAYISQYLPICLNTSFENLILLYSRKYKSKHYEIFKAIKNTVIARKSDEELLHNVLINVAEGYYYSIEGDVYLQKEWAKLKDGLNASKTEKEKLKQKKPLKKERDSKMKKSKQKAKLVDKEELSNQKEKQESKITHISTVKTTSLVKTEELPPKVSSNIEAKKTIEKLESIKDCIKRVTGYNYNIYNELFFKTVRISIRHVLENSIIQKISLFGDEENKAEDSIYEYIQQNYENPYQNWTSSKNNEYVESLGFKISSIEEIIKDWAYYNKF
ncbi:MAG: hypothetical protein ACTTJ3_06345 [Treponema sp.]